MFPRGNVRNMEVLWDVAPSIFVATLPKFETFVLSGIVSSLVHI
jgi:hypothetical protein